MSALPVTVELVEAAYQPCDDGVRRWRDLDIAEWLGLTDPYGIRGTIQTNWDELNDFGALFARQANSGNKPGTEYWLSYEQALLVCTLSRTRRAKTVRKALILTFKKVTSGELATMPRMDLRALEVAADRIVAPLLQEERVFHSEVLVRLDRHDGEIAVVKHEILDMRKQMNARRRDFPEAVRRDYIGVVGYHYNGLCPSCRRVLLVANGRLLPNVAEFDHWYGPDKRRAHHGWLVCCACNQQLARDQEFKTQKYGAFNAFQDALRAYYQQSKAQAKLEFEP